MAAQVCCASDVIVFVGMSGSLRPLHRLSGPASLLDRSPFYSIHSYLSVIFFPLSLAITYLVVFNDLSGLPPQFYGTTAGVTRVVGPVESSHW